MTNTEARYFGQCLECKARYVLSAETYELIAGVAKGPEGFFYCNCKPVAQVRFKTVSAKTVTSIVCDPKCWAAKSASCKCSCGGSEHGMSA